MPKIPLFACFVFVVCVSSLIGFSWACRIPYYCTCHGATNQYKISCDGHDVDVRDRPQFDRFLAEIPPGVKTLNVSGFSFGKLAPNAFQNFSGLRVLKLRDSQITEVAPTTFVGLSDLRRLDLSANGLKGLPQDSFQPLPRLERVDLSDNPLKCDCALKWLWDWGQRKSGASTNWPVKGVCEGGGALQEKRRSDFDFCPRKLEVADLITYPRKRQLTLAGDTIILTCIAIPLKTDADIALFWVKNGAPVNESFDSVHIKQLQTKNELRTDLDISRLGPIHDGEWVCVANSSLGIETREVTLRVVSEQTAYCPDIMTETNKGRFAWPLTLSSSRVSLPCSFHDGFAPEPVPGSSIPDVIEDRGAVVWHECGQKAAWEELDDAACPYVSVTTKILEQFADAAIDLPTEDSALKSAKYLRNYTMNATVITDPVDVVFIGRTIERYLSYVSTLPKYNRELAAELIEIAAIIQGLGNEKLLHEAQFAAGHGRTLSRIVYSVEQIPRLIPDFYHDGMRISVSSQPVEAANFLGMQCRWLNTKDGVHREIRCKPHKTFDEEHNGMTSWEESEVDDESILATVSIPSEILSPDALGKQLVRLTHTQWPSRADFGGLASSVYGWGPSRQGDFRKQQRFDFLGFDSATLFLDSVADVSVGGVLKEGNRGTRVIAGPVFGCKMSPFPSTASDPKTTIEVTLRLPFEIPPSLAREVVARAQRDRGDGSAPLPPLAGAVWNDTEAVWDVGSRHCSMTGIRGHVAFLSCRRCGYFGVSVDEKFFAKLRPWAGGHQRHPHPFVFIGSNLCAGCLFVALGVYAVLSRRLSLNSPQRHCLANSWLSMALLISLYCGGIYQTGHLQLCQSIGLLLHFFAQASVMWMINSLSYLKSRVQLPYKAAATSEEEADNGGENRHPGDQEGKLISQMYLLAYGVPLLICCLSAAVHVKEYGGPYVCTLSWRPTIWAILVPLAFAVVVLWVLYMSIFCTLKCGVVPATANGALGDEWNPNREQEHLDKEYQSELNSHAAIFLLFAFCVVFAAVAVTNDVQRDDEDKDDTYRLVWAILYCIPTAALGIFVLIRFAFQKLDFGLELEDKKSVLMLPTPPPAQPGVILPPPPSSVLASTEEPIAVNGSLSSARTGNPRVVSVGVPGTAVVTRSLVSQEGFGPPTPMPGAVPVPVAAPVVVPNPIFYDPQQMSVAKRFFEKQRRKHQKQQFAVAVGAAAAGSGADSWIEPRRHHPPPLSSVLGSESELYMRSGVHDGDETESHFTSVSNQGPNSGGHRMCKWSDSEVSVPCRQSRARWGSGGHGSGVGGGVVHYGGKQQRWPRRQRRNDSCSSRGGMEMEPLVSKQHPGLVPAGGLYQQERVVIGQESVHGMAVAGMAHLPVISAAATTSTAPPSDVLLPDVDSEDGLSLMRPLQSMTSPSRSVVSDATCATFNSSNVAACRLRSLDLNGRSHGHVHGHGMAHGTIGSDGGSGRAGGSIDHNDEGAHNDSVVSDGRRGIRDKRNETMSSLSSCSTGSCQNKRETCI